MSSTLHIRTAARTAEHTAAEPLQARHQPSRIPGVCYHGGAFFEAIGEDFSRLAHHGDIINADVLDAWFPPAPAALDALHRDLPWLLRTSPPTHCRGLIDTIARVRGLPADSIVCGAGSSDLIFRALGEWLRPESRVLILDPTYGEYAHVCEHVVGCTIDRLVLRRENGYRVNMDELRARLAQEYDLVVLVNPNNPTGQHIPCAELEPLLRQAPLSTRFWIDEAYLEYVDGAESLERFAARSPNVVVCKSLSKVYALSGARAAYLVGAQDLVARVRVLTPPWVVSLTAQLAAVRALESVAYYRECYARTDVLRAALVEELRHIDPSITTVGTGNFLLCHLPADRPDAVTIERQCRARGLFIRDVSRIVPRLGPRVIRLAVKDPATQRRMADILTDAMGGTLAGRRN